MDKPIQWYPGHMAKARRMLEEQVRLVDVVVELCDARAPIASRNPELSAVAGRKPVLLALGKADLAHPGITRSWLKVLDQEGVSPIAVDAYSARDVKCVADGIARLAKERVDRMLEKGVRKTVRAMVVGIPNVGKSTLINALFGGAATRVGDRPGVTRGKQWVKVGQYLELLDTPGMLPPKIASDEEGLRLAFIGTIKDQIMDRELLAAHLLAELRGIAPKSVADRLRLNTLEGTGAELLEAACRGRGWLLSGGRADTERGASVILDEFRSGKMGRVTLERPGLREVAADEGDRPEL